jgi:hypothetical protein
LPLDFVGSPKPSVNSSSASTPSGLPSPVQSFTWLKIG